MPVLSFGTIVCAELSREADLGGCEHCERRNYDRVPEIREVSFQEALRYVLGVEWCGVKHRLAQRRATSANADAATSFPTSNRW